MIVTTLLAYNYGNTSNSIDVKSCRTYTHIILGVCSRLSMWKGISNRLNTVDCKIFNISCTPLAVFELSQRRERQR